MRESVFFGYCLAVGSGQGVQDGSFVAPSEQELMQRGGVSWKDIMRLIMFAERLLRYADEYEDDARNGFKKGWRML